jgi:hypothetical protein
MAQTSAPAEKAEAETFGQRLSGQARYLCVKLKARFPQMKIVVISPPSGVNFEAFFSKFHRTC